MSHQKEIDFFHKKEENLTEEKQPEISPLLKFGYAIGFCFALGAGVFQYLDINNTYVSIAHIFGVVVGANFLRARFKFNNKRALLTALGGVASLCLIGLLPGRELLVPFGLSATVAGLTFFTTKFFAKLFDIKLK